MITKMLLLCFGIHGTLVYGEHNLAYQEYLGVYG